MDNSKMAVPVEYLMGLAPAHPESAGIDSEANRLLWVGQARKDGLRMGFGRSVMACLQAVATLAFMAAGAAGIVGVMFIIVGGLILLAFLVVSPESAAFIFQHQGEESRSGLIEIITNSMTLMSLSISACYFMGVDMRPATLAAWLEARRGGLWKRMGKFLGDQNPRMRKSASGGSPAVPA